MRKLFKLIAEFFRKLFGIKKKSEQIQEPDTEPEVQTEAEVQTEVKTEDPEPVYVEPVINVFGPKHENTDQPAVAVAPGTEIPGVTETVTFEPVITVIENVEQSGEAEQSGEQYAATEKVQDNPVITRKISKTDNITFTRGIAVHQEVSFKEPDENTVYKRGRIVIINNELWIINIRRKDSLYLIKDNGLTKTVKVSDVKYIEL